MTTPGNDEDQPREPLASAKSTEARAVEGKIRVTGLQYHINIVLPDTRDQGVYDAIFKSLREHLG